MFKNTFQSGFLSVLYSIGSKPLQIWDKKVRRRARPATRPGERRGLPGQARGRRNPRGAPDTCGAAPDTCGAARPPPGRSSSGRVTGTPGTG
ncbi:hypothetical protein EK904_013331 [Melospiza melodia maxima]|nr:hypothetical protein EK904_013331 [Melospiza melodia maxima]